MLVVDHRGADLDVARAGVDDAVGLVTARGQARGDEEGFDARAGLEQIGGGAVAVLRGIELMTVIGVEGRLVDHGEHFAGAHVQDDDRTGVGAIVADRRFQLAIGQVLDAQVDAELELAARAHGANALDVLDVIPLAVLDDALCTVLAAEPVVEGELRALLAGVVHVGKAEQMPGHLARRIVAAVFARQVHAVDLELSDLARVGRLEPAREVHEFAVLAGAHAPDQIVQVHVDRLGQARELLGVARKLCAG